MPHTLPGAKVIGSGVEIPGMIWIWEVFVAVISFGPMQIAVTLLFAKEKDSRIPAQTRVQLMSV
jgi:hypothetical protein